MISIIFTLLITTARVELLVQRIMKQTKRISKKKKKKRKLTPELFIKSLIAACIFYLLI